MAGGSLECSLGGAWDEMEPCACCETLLDADSIPPCTSLPPLHARLPDPAVESSGGSQIDPAFALGELSRLSQQDLHDDLFMYVLFMTSSTLQLSTRTKRPAWARKITVLNDSSF